MNELFCAPAAVDQYELSHCHSAQPIQNPLRWESPRTFKQLEQ
jgi:hypothetical protein